MKNRRIIVSRFGGPDALQIVEEDLPNPGPGQVRLRVEAAGVAWGDVQVRRGFGIGLRPPFTPGYDLIGTVDSLGAGVTGIEIGRRFAAFPLLGGYTRFICLPAADLVPLPDGVDVVTAAAVPLNYLVALQMLHRAARVETGDRVLVHGAAGGVGRAMVELCRLAGLVVYGTTSTSHCASVAQAGATPIDYRKEDFARRILALTGQGVGAAFDAIGGSHTLATYRVLRPRGRLVDYGFEVRAGRDNRTTILAKIARRYLLSAALNLLPGRRRVVVYDVSLPTYRSRQQKDLARLLELLKAGAIHPQVGKCLPLEEAARAHRFLEEGSVSGKIILLL